MAAQRLLPRSNPGECAHTILLCMAPITSCASRSSCSSAIEIVVPKKLCCWREYAKHFASTIGLARATSRLDAIAATASSNESPRESTRFPSINPAASTLNPRNGAMAIPLAKSGPQRLPGAHFGRWPPPWPKLVPRGLLELILALGPALAQNWSPEDMALPCCFMSIWEPCCITFLLNPVKTSG